MIGKQLGNFTIIKSLGAGAMGQVYEAIEDPLGRRVALKLLDLTHARDPHLRARFQNEARATNLIGHPGVISIYSLGETAEGAPYLVMELLPGETLRERMRREGSLPWSMVLGITKQLASALRATHACGIVHRDIKPANIILTPDAEAPGGVRTKLLDFGIAKLPPPMATPATEVRTHTGMVMGTPEYMAPEQCRDGAGVDGRADVYALAATLFHALTGQLPVGVPGQRTEALLYAQLHQEPRSLRALCPLLPPAAGALWQRMLAKDRDRRPSLEEITEALRALPDDPIDAELPLRPGQTVRSYRVVRLLCLGPRGAFFEAEHQDSPAVHALIKVPSPAQLLDAQAGPRLRAEAQALMLITDPGVVKILDFGQLPSGVPYVITEHLPSRSLRSVCDLMAEQMQRYGTNRRLRGEQQAAVLRIGRQVAAALEAGHSTAMMARNLSPDGLLVVTDHAHHAEPLVKVLDLGFGETLAKLPLPARVQPTGLVAEQEDVAQLGALLRTLLANGAPATVKPAGPRALQALLQSLCDPQAQRRPRLAEVITALDRMQASTLLEGRPRWVARLATMALVLLLVLPWLGGAGFFQRQRPAEGAVSKGASLAAVATHSAPAVQEPRITTASAPDMEASAPAVTALPLVQESRTRSGSHQHSKRAAGDGSRQHAPAIPEPVTQEPGPSGPGVTPNQPKLEVLSTPLVQLRTATLQGGSIDIKQPGTPCGDAHCYHAGEVLELRAQPNPGATLAEWTTPPCHQQNPCKYTVPASGEVTLAARFSQSKVAVKFDVLGGCGGTINYSADGVKPGTCDGDCSGNVPSGVELKLEAKGSEGCRFSSWRGSCQHDRTVCQLQSRANLIIHAYFTADGTIGTTNTNPETQVNKGRSSIRDINKN